MKSEKFIHVPGSVLDSTDRCSSSGPKNMRVCESKNKNPGLFKFRTLLYIGTLFTFHFSLFTLLTSCNETFEPFTVNDNAAFSIFGFLDASADTQWVRVTPLRKLVNQPLFKPEMSVTLQNLESGESFAMNDSLLLFPDGFHILNAWTPINIEPNQTYMLKAEQPDGKQSSVTVSTPEDFPEPQLVYLDNEGCSALLIIKDIERLADVIYRWHVQINRPGLVFRSFVSVPFRSSIRQVSSGEHIVRVDFRSARRLAGGQLINTSFQILDMHILVAAGGPEWVENLASFDDEVYNRHDVFTNIDDGVGYMAGILTKTVPDDRCT